MLRDRFADREFLQDIDRFDTISIDKIRLSDVPISDFHLLGVDSPKYPSEINNFRYPPSITDITTTGIDFKKIIPFKDGGGVGDVGDLTLEEKGKKISIYIIIGAVIVVGFLAMRRK